MAMAHLPQRSSSQDSVSFGKMSLLLSFIHVLHSPHESRGTCLNRTLYTAHREPDCSLNIVDICSRGRSDQII